MHITFTPIGLIHSPFETIEGMPIQAAGAQGVTGHIAILPQYQDGLQDLEGFSHIILLYWFHQVTGARLRVTPFLDDQERGVFATRAPTRPNPIGLSVVKLTRIENNLLYIENVDILNQTPLLDIKPYVPAFDQHQADRTGWLARTENQAAAHKSDQRFR